MWHGAYYCGPGREKPSDGSTSVPHATITMLGRVLPKRTNCKRIGHLARDCKSWPVAANNNQRAQGANQRVLTCFECGAQVHFRSDCPKLKNGPGEKKPYRGSKPLCRKCNYYYVRPRAPKCTNCKRIGHLARDCKSWPVAANNNQRAQGGNQRVLTCFECGAQVHFRSDCPKLKNGNQGNRAVNGNVVARAYAVGTAGTNPNSNVVMGTFLLNNRYASI
ncbi:putative reverse transcriptase domain-containing protein [Tanacetum coccineum]